MSTGRHRQNEQLRWWEYMNSLDNWLRKRGRPRNTWNREVANILKQQKLDWKEAEIQSEDSRKLKRISFVVLFVDV